MKEFALVIHYRNASLFLIYFKNLISNIFWTSIKTLYGKGNLTVFF